MSDAVERERGSSEALKQLAAMGFPEAVAMPALRRTQNNVGAAADILLGLESSASCSPSCPAPGTADSNRRARDDGSSAQLARPAGEPATASSAALSRASGNPAQAAAPAPSKPRKRHRQASESSDGCVAVLCFACRRRSDSSKQQELGRFFSSRPRDSAAPPTSSDARDADIAAAPATLPASMQTTATSLVPDAAAASATDSTLFCSSCRRPMEKPVRSSAGKSTSSSRVLPHIVRLRQYRRLSADQGIPFAIAEHAAAAMMRLPCTTCGAAAPLEGHGLTRLRVWPAGCDRPPRGGFMGPYHVDNVAPACTMCNMMKGHRRVRFFVEAARHIATHRGGHGDFGRYPHRFRNNISKRSRSAYITASSTHTKTHALSNETFARIVARPCRYCGKPSDPPRHHNGLDRIDSSVRVYTEETCDSCCGDCNMMKYKWSEDAFISQCLKVAEFNVGKESWPGDVDEDDAQDDSLVGAEADDLPDAREDPDSIPKADLEACDAHAPAEDTETVEEDANPFADFAFRGC